MIAEQITNKAQFNPRMVGDFEERIPVTHILNHFPHLHSVNLEKKQHPCPVGPTGIIMLLFYS